MTSLDGRIGLPARKAVWGRTSPTLSLPPAQQLWAYRDPYRQRISSIRVSRLFQLNFPRGKHPPTQ